MATPSSTPQANPSRKLNNADHAVIVDVEATRAIRQAEVGAGSQSVKRYETLRS